MKHTIAICAGLLTVGLSASSPAGAQVIYQNYQNYQNHQNHQNYRGYPIMPPAEAAAIVRAIGLEPVGRPIRHGPTYVLSALDPAGAPVRVVVDARLGRILGVSMAPPPSGRPPGLIPPMAEPAAQAGPPPLPRPRPKVALAASADAKPAVARSAPTPPPADIEE